MCEQENGKHLPRLKEFDGGAASLNSLTNTKGMRPDEHEVDIEAGERKISFQSDHNVTNENSGCYDTEPAGTQGGNNDRRQPQEQVLPGAVAVNGIDGPQSQVLSVLPRTLDENHQTSIAVADAVDNAEVVVFASSVSPDERVKMRRILTATGVFAFLLAIALIVGFTYTFPQSSSDHQGDSRCLLVPEEQDIFAHCSCSNTTKGLFLTDEEQRHYEKSKKLALEHGLISEIPVGDSCSIENQCLLSGSNYKRRNTPDEVAWQTLNKTKAHGIQFFTLCLIYSSLDGRNWERNDDWMVTHVVCNWFGVSCTSLQHVIELDLSSNNLSGTLLSDIQHMPFLREYTGHKASELCLLSPLSHECSIAVQVNWIFLTMKDSVEQFRANCQNQDLCVSRFRRMSAFYSSSFEIISDLIPLYPESLDLSQTSMNGTLPRELGNMQVLGELFT